MSAQDGSRWVEDEIRYGLREGWGEEEAAITTIVEAKLTMPQDRLGPRVEAKVLAFREDRNSAMTNVVLTGDLTRGALRQMGREIAQTLKKTLSDKAAVR